MLSPLEKIIFAIAALITAYAVVLVTIRIVRLIARGGGEPDWSLVPKRALAVLVKVTALTPVWRMRLLVSFFHALVVWGFMFYLLVNIGDVLEGYLACFHFFGAGLLGNLYRLAADVLSVCVLVGMIALMVRRFVRKDPALETRASTLLHPKAKAGMRRDSLIVGLFILFHVGSRFVGESFQIAREGADAWQPFASALSKI